MCSAFQLKRRFFKPGSEVIGTSERGVERHVWAGFSRNESLEWWLRRGGRLMDLPVDRFAERSEITRQLIWQAVEEGRFLRAVIQQSPEKQTESAAGTTIQFSTLVKIMTRAATEEEREHFQHARVPLLGPSRFAPVPKDVLENFLVGGSVTNSLQIELF